MRSITTPELCEMIVLGHYKYKENGLKSYEPEEPFLGSFITESEEDERCLSEFSYEELVQLKSKVDSINMCIEAEYVPLTEFVSRNAWRLPMWAVREVREHFDIFQCAILLAMGKRIDLQPELSKPLQDMIRADEQSVKLFHGDKTNLSKIEVLEKLWTSAEETKPLTGEHLIEHLRNAIPESTRSVYPENVYDAAIKVFSILHNNYAKKLDKFMQKIEEQNSTPKENTQYVVEGLPSFKRLACDKVSAWKDLNITPTVAKVKMLAGKQLSDSEADSVLREMFEVKTGAMAINASGRYREDIAQRVYVDQVRGYRRQEPQDPPVRDPCLQRRERPARDYDGRQDEFDPDELPVPKMIFVGIALIILNMLIFKSFWLYVAGIGIIAFNWMRARGV